MLDLNKLERKLDEALSKETEESLRNWLKGKRMNSFFASLGEGEMKEVSWLPDNTNSGIINEEPIHIEISYNDTYSDESFLIAA